MPAKTKSVDEILSERKDQILLDGKGLVKALSMPATWNPANRTGRFVMSSEAPDRYKDVVVTAGCNETNFLSNPVALLFHARQMFPIGKWSGIDKMTTKRPPRLEGDLELLPASVLEEADTAASLIGAGILRACSIGFMPNYNAVEPIKDKEGNYTGGYQFNEWELVECSLVPVPAHPGALIKDAAGDEKMLRAVLERQIDEWCDAVEGLGVSREDYIKVLTDMGPRRLALPKVEEKEIPEVHLVPGAKKMKKKTLKALAEMIAEAMGRKPLEPTKSDEETVPVVPVIVAGSTAAAAAKSKAFLDRLQTKGLVE